MNWTIFFALGSALLALIYGAVSITQVMKLPRGNETMQGISDTFRETLRSQRGLPQGYMT